jgi:hypothetical protein
VDVPSHGSELEHLIDLAFEYRGDVTIDRVDESPLIGYLFNRNASGSAPYVELFETATGQRQRLPYADIRNIRFTGRDAAAGKSHEAWKRRREAQANSSHERD